MYLLHFLNAAISNEILFATLMRITFHYFFNCHLYAQFSTHFSVNYFFGVSFRCVVNWLSVDVVVLLCRV